MSDCIATGINMGVTRKNIGKPSVRNPRTRNVARTKNRMTRGSLDNARTKAVSCCGTCNHASMIENADIAMMMSNGGAE